MNLWGNILIFALLIAAPAGWGTASTNIGHSSPSGEKETNPSTFEQLQEKVRLLEGSEGSTDPNVWSDILALTGELESEPNLSEEEKTFIKETREKINGLIAVENVKTKDSYSTKENKDNYAEAEKLIEMRKSLEPILSAEEKKEFDRVFSEKIGKLGLNYDAKNKEIIGSNLGKYGQGTPSFPSSPNYFEGITSNNFNNFSFNSGPALNPYSGSSPATHSSAPDDDGLAPERANEYRAQLEFWRTEQNAGDPNVFKDKMAPLLNELNNSSDPALNRIPAEIWHDDVPNGFATLNDIVAENYTPPTPPADEPTSLSEVTNPEPQPQAQQTPILPSPTPAPSQAGSAMASDTSSPSGPSGGSGSGSPSTPAPSTPSTASTPAASTGDSSTGGSSAGGSSTHSGSASSGSSTSGSNTGSSSSSSTAPQVAGSLAPTLLTAPSIPTTSPLDPARDPASLGNSTPASTSSASSSPITSATPSDSTADKSTNVKLSPEDSPKGSSTPSNPIDAAGFTNESPKITTGNITQGENITVGKLTGTATLQNDELSGAQPLKATEKVETKNLPEGSPIQTREIETGDSIKTGKLEEGSKVISGNIEKGMELSTQKIISEKNLKTYFNPLPETAEKQLANLAAKVTPLTVATLALGTLATGQPQWADWTSPKTQVSPKEENTQSPRQLLTLFGKNIQRQIVGVRFPSKAPTDLGAFMDPKKKRVIQPNRRLASP